MLVAVVLASAGATAAPANAHSRDGAYMQMAAKMAPDWSTPYELVDGVPYVGYDSFKAFNPVTVAQYGLAQWSLWWRHRDRGRLVKARRAAAWLLKRQRARGDWTYSFAWRAAGASTPLAPGWSSALAQGQALSLLGRFYRRTRDRRYLRAIRRAIVPLATPVRRGGLARWYRGGLYFEEYPTARRNFVLNGHIQTLVGLHDVADIAGRRAQSLLRRGTRTMARSIGEFDLPGRRMSVYSLAWRKPPPPSYNPLIRDMLRLLSKVSGRRTFARYADRWSAP